MDKTDNKKNNNMTWRRWIYTYIPSSVGLLGLDPSTPRKGMSCTGYDHDIDNPVFTLIPRNKKYFDEYDKEEDE